MILMKQSRKSGIGSLAAQSKKVTELINNGQIRLAKEIILDLISEYPNDEISKVQLARINILERNYEESLIILEQLEEKNVFLKLASLYIELNYEDKLYGLYKKYFCNNFYRNKYKGDMKYRLLDIYLNKKFNSNYSLNTDKVSYFEKQVYSYDRELAINHIKDGHLDSNNGEGEFSTGVDIEKLYDKVNRFIKNNLNDGYLLQVVSKSFYFYIPGIGKKVGNEEFDCLYVCTVVGTNEIITMFPVKKRKYASYLTLDKIDNKDMGKVKKRVKSGLERFNDRYKLN